MFFLRITLKLSVTEIFNAEVDEHWAGNKKFAAQAFREFGGRQAGVGEKIQEELSIMMDRIKTGVAMDISPSILPLSTNIISSIVFNERFDYDDPKLQYLIDIILRLYAAINKSVMLITLLPSWMARLFFSSTVKELDEAYGVLKNYTREKVRVSGRL